MSEIIKNDKYWELHKRLINDKYNELDNDSYQEVINNPNCELAIKIDLEIKSQLEKTFSH